jgi:3-hydroxyacyl-CoA dehydrogenase/enoyl-CoA hydratase/3-hydroxybutyryl-CoA epimerase
VLDQTRADYRAEGQTYIASPGELLVERMVKEWDRNGRAAGGKKQLWPRLKDLFEKPAAPWRMQELKDRLLYRQSIETARCLAEGVLTSVHDANVGSIFGIGFPGWTGGAMQFIYGTGVDTFLQRAAVLASKYGEGFVVAPEAKDAIRRFAPAH